MLVVLPARQLCSPYNVTRSFPRTLARSKRQCHLELPEPEKPSPAQQVPPVPCTVRTVDVPTFLVQPALFPPLWLLANADERSAIRDLFFSPSQGSSSPPPPLGSSHFELGSRWEGLSSFRAPVHPTSAAKQSQLYSNCAARRGYRDCLPTPRSIHSSTRSLPSLPSSTYKSLHTNQFHLT